MKQRFVIIGCFTAAALIGVAALIFLAPALLGAPDPGPVDFATLTRTPDGDDALICPRTLCAKAAPDMEPPIFTSSADALKAQIRRYAHNNGLVDEIRSKKESEHLRFVQRRSIFKAPIYIDVLFQPLTADAATIALYARDAGASRKGQDFLALRKWLDAAAQ